VLPNTSKRNMRAGEIDALAVRGPDPKASLLATDQSFSS
jgi:hypothetical protein